MDRAKSAVRIQERVFKRLRRSLRDAAKLCKEKELKLVDIYLVGSRELRRLSRIKAI